jgi:N-dimethylarginine dimethylaminohydrolase
MPHAQQPLPQFLMCPPTHYRIAYEINPWMSLRRQANHPRATLQWRRLYAVLTQRLGARVRLLPPARGVPDLVFTANAGLVAGRRLIRSNFRHPQRQRETPLIERYFRRTGYSIIRLPQRYNFEGEGDALWMGPTLLFGFRFRSDAPAHEFLSRILRAEVLPVELVDRRFYHLDTCFCPLDARRAMWFPKAFDRYGQRVIERLVPVPIAVSEADAVRFACNAVAFERALVLPAGCSHALRRRLTRLGLQVWPVELSEFLKAGGAAKCLVLRLAAGVP